MKFFAERARMMAFDLRARGFDEFSVIDTRGTCSRTRHAAKAGIKMTYPLRVDTRVAFAGELHQVNSATRRVHLFVPENVSRANGQAESAVDAGFDDLFGGWMVRIEGAGQCICVRKSSHKRALLAATREHNRMAVLLANKG